MATVAIRKIDDEYLTAAAGPTSHSPPPIEVAAMIAPGPMTLKRFRALNGGGAGRSATSQRGKLAVGGGQGDAVAHSGVAHAGSTRSSMARRTASKSAGSSTGRLAWRERDAVQRPVVVADLELGELQPVGGRDDDDPLVRRDDAALLELDERRQGHAGVRAVEHARAIGERRRVGQLVLGRLLDDAVELLQRCGSPSGR